MVTIAGGDAGAPQVTASNINGVIQTVLAAQLVSRTGMLEDGNARNDSSHLPAGVSRKS